MGAMPNGHLDGDVLLVQVHEYKNMWRMVAVLRERASERETNKDQQTPCQKKQQTKRALLQDYGLAEFGL